MKRTALVLIVCSGSLAAADPGTNPVLAEQLFEQGRELAKHDDWANACPKFEASLQYDPTLGTKLNLATCYEKVGKLASAWSLYREAAELAATANDAKRRDYATKRASELLPRLPRLTIVAPADLPNGFAVTRDGTHLDSAAFGTSLYVDPGEHAIVASAPGFESFTTTTTLVEKQAATVKLPPLEPSKTPVMPVAPTPVQPPEPTKAEPPPTSDTPPRTRAYVGIGTAIGGVVITGAGLVFGALASSHYSDAKHVCPDLACTSDADYARGHQLVSDARKDGNISTALVIVGGVAVAGGVVLYLTAPKAHPTETARIVPSVTPHAAALVLEGSF